jgi:RimJ/RimL family protein N-acetyltransferase
LLPFHDPKRRFRAAPTIETERLILRDFALADIDYFMAFFSDAQASEHVGGPSGTEDTWRRMLAGVGLWPLTGLGMWAVERREDGATIGHVGFFDFLRDSEPSIAGAPEMGWILAPVAHGKGYAKEACDAALAWFERNFGRHAMWALISPGNDPSMKLAEKLGFVRQADGMYRDRPQTIWLRSA